MTPYTRHTQKINVKVVQKLNRQTDGQTDGGDCITSRVDAVVNKLLMLFRNVADVDAA